MSASGKQAGAKVVRVKADFNEQNREGHVVTRLANADGPVSPGDKVHAFEPCDGIIADAEVASVVAVGAPAYYLLRLAVDWNSFRDDPEMTEDRSCE